MSIFSNESAEVPAANKTADTKANRPKSKWWLNFGYSVTTTNEETGGEEDTFISLPYGLPVDTMENSSIEGKDANWLNRMVAGNNLLADLKELCETMKPGQTRILLGEKGGLQVQLRRIADNVQAASTGENPYLKAAPKIKLVA